MPVAPTSHPPDDAADEDPSHPDFCRDHDDPTLDCSSSPVRTEGGGGAVTTWMTRTNGIDYAYVASVALTRPSLGTLIDRLQLLQHQMH